MNINVTNKKSGNNEYTINDDFQGTTKMFDNEREAISGNEIIYTASLNDSLRAEKDPLNDLPPFSDIKIRSAEPHEGSALLRNMGEKLHLKCGMALKNRNIIVDILAIFFGIGTWIGVNGLFVELPLLVDGAPEGWSLPSYLSVMVQIGNVGPLAYTVLQRYSLSNVIKDVYLIYALLVLGTAAALGMAFMYNYTAIIFGSEHSVALYVLSFLMALEACTSSVLFMPYMGRFKEMYLVTFFVGEGLSGMLSGVVSLIQGIGGSAQCVLTNTTVDGVAVYEKYTPPPAFGTMEYFIFIAAMLVCSCIGFTLLDRLPLVKKEYAAMQVANGNDYVYQHNVVQQDNAAAVDVQQSASANDIPVLTSTQYRSLLLAVGIVSFFSNGVLNSIQSYSCLPYGNEAYHYSTTLSFIANPVACFLAIFLPRSSLRSIIKLSILTTIFLVYVLLTALMSPVPPLKGTEVGMILIITVWTLLIGLISFIKLSITTVMRAQGGKSLVWTGALFQLGSIIGSVLTFVLINFTHTFHAADKSDPC